MGNIILQLYINIYLKGIIACLVELVDTSDLKSGL